MDMGRSRVNVYVQVWVVCVSRDSETVSLINIVRDARNLLHGGIGGVRVIRVIGRIGYVILH